MPAFDTQCIRTYITASELPSQGVAGSNHNWEHNPRLAPPDALPEKINPDEHTFVRGAKTPLPRYSEHRVPTKYSRIVAIHGSPFQVHFMVWSQQTIPEFDFPGDFNEPEFMDLRVEVSFNSEVVDTGYINHRNITYGGIPFGLEITGKTVGDSVEIPFMFNGGPSTELSEDGSPKQLKNAQIDVLVTAGRLGPYLTYQRNRNRKVIKVAPFCPLVSYESSVADKSFKEYEWFKKNQDMMFDRDENPDTKLWEWRRGWAEADVYRQQVEARAYWERRISMRHITLKSVFWGSPVPQNPEFPPIPTVQQILQLNGCYDHQIMEASARLLPTLPRHRQTLPLLLKSTMSPQYHRVQPWNHRGESPLP